MSTLTPTPTRPPLPPAGTIFAALVSRERDAAIRLRRTMTGIEALLADATLRADVGEIERLTLFIALVSRLAAVNDVRALRWEEISAAAGGNQPIVAGQQEPGGTASPADQARLPDVLTPVVLPSDGNIGSETPTPAPSGQPARVDGLLAEVELAEVGCARSHVAAASVVANREAHAELAAAATAVGEGLATLRAALRVDPFVWEAIPPR